MAFRDVDILAGEAWPLQKRVQGFREVNNVVFYAKLIALPGGAFKLFGVALAVVDRNGEHVLVFVAEVMEQNSRIHASRNDTHGFLHTF